jgi:predicted metal-binding membrane protein
MTDTQLRQEHAERSDTPRAAYARLPRAVTVRVAAALLVAAAAGWVYTFREADGMSGMAMVMGLGQVGGMAMAMTVSSFLAMWAAMMVGMMSPTLVPVALAHRAAAGERRGGGVSTAAFAIGFLLVWAATGVIALGAYKLILEIPASAADSSWLPALAGAVLIGVGVFQLTPWKFHCLRECRAPMASAGGIDPSAGVARSFRTGLAHGWRCLGCCWALMVVLLVVGMMNLAWMAVIAAIFFVDKHWARAEGLTRVVGVFFIALGLAVTAFPDLLAFISGVDANAPAGGDMGGMEM